MTIEQQIKDLILERSKTVKDFAKEIGMPYGTLDGVLRRGILASGTDNVFRLCKALGISIDALADGVVEETNTERKPKDISQIEEDYLRKCFPTLDGQPITENELKELRDEIRRAVSLIRKERILSKLTSYYDRMERYFRIVRVLNEETGRNESGDLYKSVNSGTGEGRLLDTRATGTD